MSSSASCYEEIGKRLRTIYEDAEIEYGAEPTDMDTLTSRFKIATKLRERSIAEVFKSIQRARNVQLCFLVDVTGSMQKHIDGVRKSIDDILKKLIDDGSRTHSPNARVAQSMTIAFVAYRDHGDTDQFEHPCDSCFADLRFCRLRFCFCAIVVCAFVVAVLSCPLQADGGDDGPEDVFGGIDIALDLAWSENCGTKVIFHICDAPCHGNEFHSAGTGDNYPSGDPKGRTCKELFSRLRENGIQYHFGKITKHTDIMIQKFSEAYGEPITDFDVKNVNDITDSVTSAVKMAISASVMASHRTAGVSRKERKFTLDKTEPDWESLSEMEGEFVSYAFPKDMEHIKSEVPLERKVSKRAIVKIANNPFGRGAERIAYYGKDVSTFVVKDESKKEKVLTKNEDIVLKENLHTGKGENSADRYELSNQMQTIASFLAQKYVADLKDKAGINQTIKFLKIRTISVKHKGASPWYMSVERRFAADAKFVRFTNNAGYRILEEQAVALGVSTEFIQLVTAFSHWTYKASDRFLMVVDLEGVIARIEGEGKTGVLLTDPAIHCKDLTRYGGMNLGLNGMKNFFQRHECNQFCKVLGLEGVVC